MTLQDPAVLLGRARRWRAADPDPTTRAQIDQVLERADPAELDELFGAELEFGTAGLRAALGPGPNRMNRLVVRRTASAIAAHVLDAAAGPPDGARTRPLVVVGHDARHGSEDFGRELVEVLSAAGVDVEHFDEPVPTPLVAFAVRARAATAGVMVTASHNPAGDNGLKLYAADGAQIVAPTDGDIAERLRALPLAATGRREPEAAAGAGSVGSLGGPTRGGTVVERYLARAASLVADDALPSPLRVAHTALHGVGDALLRRALGRLDGVTAWAVPEQQLPDPEFPTVASPNPEEPGTLDAVLTLALARAADVALALDPDADRLAVALPGPPDSPGWRTLNGDESGALLASHLLAGSRDPDRLVATTIVSSRLVPAMCAAAGVHHVETPTGFKWLCRPGIEHPGWTQLLLYEEALGYAVGRDARDKDGITAALVVLEAVATWRSRGTTAWEVLDELARRHGAHVTRNGSVHHRSLRHLLERVDALGATPPTSLGGIDVARADRPVPGVLRWWLEDATRVIVRPSGTEPKVKYYVEAIEPVTDDVGAARATARRRLEPVVDELALRLTS